MGWALTFEFYPELQIQIIQNQFKISEGGKWNSHQMPCVYSSPMVKNYRICPIRIEIIHGRHRVAVRSAVLCMGTMDSCPVVPKANEPHANLCMLYTA
jgi:hypothetical protein